MTTIDVLDSDHFTSDVIEGDTPLLSNTRKSFQNNEAVTLGSFDAAIRASSSDERCPSSDEDYQENERNIANRPRRRRLTPSKILPSRNAISCLARKVKDRSLQKVIGGTEKNHSLSVGYSKFEC
uniref:Uncharacterized protein n=1 Tax=Eucampia antarctica TaxID=49252 RepID=A0A7S2R1M9_9STRA